MLTMVTTVTAIVVMQIVSQSLCVLRITVIKIVKLEVSIVRAFNGKNLVSNFVRIGQYYKLYYKLKR